jgi:hypothetical protein
MSSIPGSLMMVSLGVLGLTALVIAVEAVRLSFGW